MDDEPTKENRPVTCGIIDSIFDCCSVQPMIILLLFVYCFAYIYYINSTCFILMSVYYSTLLYCRYNEMVSIKKYCLFFVASI